MRFLVLGLILAAGWVGADAQAKPDFSGKWVIASAQHQERIIGRFPVTFSSPLIGECLATQEASTLTFKDAQGATLVAVAFDGSETRLALPEKPPRALVWKASWEGRRLVVMTRVDPPRREEPPVKQVFSLAPDGSLVLEYQQYPTWPVITFIYKRA